MQDANKPFSSTPSAVRLSPEAAKNARFLQREWAAHVRLKPTIARVVEVALEIAAKQLRGDNGRR